MCRCNNSWAREQKNRVVGVERLRADKGVDSDGKDCGERGVEATEEGEANSRAASALTQASAFSIADEQLSSSPVQLCKVCSITKTSVSCVCVWRGGD